MTFCSHISNSKEDTYRQCGWKYHLKYNLKLWADQKRAPLQFGSYIHRVFELGVNAKSIEELREIAKTERKNYHFSDSDYSPAVVEKCLKNFLKLNDKLEETIGIELDLTIERKGFSQRAIIDRVIRGLKGGILVLDYKTSKKEKTKGDLFKDRQLQGYVAAIATEFNEPINNITAGHFYPITNHLVIVKYHPWQTAKRIKDMGQIVWDIRKKKYIDFTPRQNEFCNWCEYRHVCPLFEDIGVANKRIDEWQKQVRAREESIERLDSALGPTKSNS